MRLDISGQHARIVLINATDRQSAENQWETRTHNGRVYVTFWIRGMYFNCISHTFSRWIDSATTNSCIRMPESVDSSGERPLSTDSTGLEPKSMELLHDAPKKELVSNPPVLLPTSRRRRSSSTRSSVKAKEPEVVARRNARERRRVKLVNDGFLRLRKHVPTDPKNKKLSKVKTLRSAIDYIRHLQQLLNQASKNSTLQLPDFSKLDVLHSSAVNANGSWFSNLDLVCIWAYCRNPCLFLCVFQIICARSCETCTCMKHNSH